MTPIERWSIDTGGVPKASLDTGNCSRVGMAVALTQLVWRSADQKHQAAARFSFRFAA